MASDKQAVADLKSRGFQSFTMVKVHRSRIKNAPYNPRTLGEAEKRKLKSVLKKHGLVAPLTWNVRTGNMVGGHQRLSQLDSLMGTSDYELDVAQIDVDDTREKEINIALNNPNAQGDWDLEQLNTLLKVPGLDFAGAGFDHADVFRMFGDSVVEARDDPLDELAAKVREARELYGSISERSAGRDNDNFFIVVVFRDEAQLTGFLQRAKLPDNRYQSGEEIMRLCNMVDDEWTCR
ncbi:ParB/RepB/Spo0J family partition protein [Bradyrhizobium sp. Leo121]|uniref:ParB/RepB/Spo0J family partition protein n=1 Tax=Bradyrhizobium sp. Leo121 TaxID=1571195 RepID=UPI00102A5647|nr:ParB/RepB/Spo0J family partition protein [Bradyrhizobium sp. Leo121]RZN30510.1 hypothetical protein CWO90_20450 [Bradyrhizobium sp. Leo121]